MKPASQKPNNQTPQPKQKEKTQQQQKSVNRSKHVNSKSVVPEPKQQQNPKKPQEKAEKAQKPEKNIPKINSIVSLAKNENSKEPSKDSKRPISQQKKRQIKSIERLIVNRNGPSKSIADVKEMETSKPISHTKDIKEKDIGLVWMNPEHDTLSFEQLQTADPVYEKYYEMISNDSDTIFVMNAIPEIKPYKTEATEDKVDFFLSNRMARISGQFSQLTSQKVISILKTKPAYLDSKSKVINQKLILSTKWKVTIDVGFMQHLVQPNRIVVTRVYLSRIYRRMNYLAYFYIQILLNLFSKYESIDKISIFLHDRNIASIKFLKFVGGKIERIFTDSSNQKVDYYQEFVCRRKDVMNAAGKLQLTTSNY